MNCPSNASGNGTYPSPSTASSLRVGVLLHTPYTTPQPNFIRVAFQAPFPCTRRAVSLFPNWTEAECDAAPSRIPSTDHSPARVSTVDSHPPQPSANVASCLAACPGRTHDPGPCSGCWTGTASSFNSWPWLARAGVPLSPSVSAPPTRPPYRATFLCLLAQIFQTNASLLSVGLSSFYSQICSGTEHSLTTCSSFASNKSQGPNFSPPSITLSDVGPDPGLSSTGQDKPTLQLVFCGCRVLMLVGPDPRSPFALFLSLSSLSSFFASPPEPETIVPLQRCTSPDGQSEQGTKTHPSSVQILCSLSSPSSTPSLAPKKRFLQPRIGPVELSAASYTYLPTTPHRPPLPCPLLPFTIPVPRSGRTPNTAHPPTPTPIRRWPDPTANVYSHIKHSSVLHAKRQHSRRHSVSNLNRPADRFSRVLGAPIRLDFAGANLDKDLPGSTLVISIHADTPSRSDPSSNSPQLVCRR
ncbi:hypothetical protein CNYM01_10995 [Colletotrichum nymphaeae SA-01]|uniref:Uncharacterized protein n=1 Tax=Colletotrichum nymphaeae SA-01 TaxID=1460502 RepID=A0A135UKQ2_9PEZI|nr:hypothetical protein CNYM01_10995 [Colletotrichum nymphaeae SA-01]